MTDKMATTQHYNCCILAYCISPYDSFNAAFLVHQCFHFNFTGFLFGMRAFAPLLGFVLGAWTNSLYVDLSGKLVIQ